MARGPARARAEGGRNLGAAPRQLRGPLPAGLAGRRVRVVLATCAPGLAETPRGIGGGGGIVGEGGGGAGIAPLVASTCSIHPWPMSVILTPREGQDRPAELPTPRVTRAVPESSCRLASPSNYGSAVCVGRRGSMAERGAAPRKASNRLLLPLILGSSFELTDGRVQMSRQNRPVAGESKPASDRDRGTDATATMARTAAGKTTARIDHKGKDRGQEDRDRREDQHRGKDRRREDDRKDRDQHRGKDRGQEDRDHQDSSAARIAAGRTTARTAMMTSAAVPWTPRRSGARRRTSASPGSGTTRARGARSARQRAALGLGVPPGGTRSPTRSRRSSGRRCASSSPTARSRRPTTSQAR